MRKPRHTIEAEETPEPRRSGRSGPPPGPGKGIKRPPARAAAKEDLGPYWLFGHHAVAQALQNPLRETGRLVATRNARRELSLAEGQAEDLSPKQIADLLPPGAVHQGVALEVWPLPRRRLGEVVTKADPAPPLLVLDQVTDPHNVGAILRSAAAFGAGGLITTDRHAPQESGVLAKAASGGLEVVPWVRVTNLARALEALGEAGYSRLGLDETGEDVLGQFGRLPRVALVLGAEGKGLRQLTKEKCDRLLRLPTGGPVATLNVSNAAAVGLFALGSGTGLD